MASRRRPPSTTDALGIIVEAARRGGTRAPTPKRRARRSENTRRVSKKKTTPQMRAGGRINLDTPEVGKATTVTISKIEDALGDLDAFEASVKAELERAGPSKRLSRYGLPKAKLHRFTSIEEARSSLENRWQRIVDRYDEQLEDLLNAAEAGIISQTEFKQLEKPIFARLKKARAELDRAERLRERKPTPPRQPTKRKRS